MKFEKLLEIVGHEPVFHSGMLLSGQIDPIDLGRQLSRWVRAGKLMKLRRGIYTLPEQYRKVPLHPFVVANRLKRASYVSIQSALEHYGLIPEYVPSVTSVTTGRPETYATPVGDFLYRHIKLDLFSDYALVDIGGGQSAYVARPEKALLDLLYLTVDSDDPGFIRELRLQNIDTVDMDALSRLAAAIGNRKVVRAVAGIRNLHETGSGS